MLFSSSASSANSLPLSLVIVLNIYSKNIELYTDSQGITANGNQKQGYESTAYVKIGSKNAYSDTLVIRGATDDTAASHGIAAFCNGNIDIYAKDIDIKFF